MKAELAALKAADRCEWFETDNDRGLWECGKCHAEWTLEAGNPIDNQMHFCPQCGAKITAINALEWHDQEDEWGYKQTELPAPPKEAT